MSARESTTETTGRREIRISRRGILRIIAAGGAAAWALKSGLGDLPRGEARTYSRVIMGTIVNLTLVAADRSAAEAAMVDCLDGMSDLEAILSRFRPDSHLALLNRDGQVTGASPHLLGLLALSREIAERSEGAFDVTVKPLVDLYQRYHTAGLGLPAEEEVRAALAVVDYRDLRVTEDEVRLARPGMAVTLDGIAKGYIVDRGVEALRRHGCGDVLVEAGGDLAASGENAAQAPWRVGIQSPRAQQGRLLARFGLRDQAAATSGDYMQAFTPDFAHHHIVDPHTGYSAPWLASATAIAPSAALADGLATVLMNLSRQRGAALLTEFPGCSGYLVTKDLETIAIGQA